MEWRARSAHLDQLPPSHSQGFREQLPKLIRHVLLSRGLLAMPRVEDWLSPRLKDLRDPNCLHKMDVAVARLVQAFERRETVCIYADFDLDGTTGLALLKRGFDSLGFSDVRYYQPRRLAEGYGVHVHAIEQIHAQGSTLVVTVDVGITAFAAAARAKELGLDLIITDHHLPAREAEVEKLPEALAVVNPNQESCRSELGHLSGAGVAFYLLLAVKRELQKRALMQGECDLKELLDFFVIGTLTDLVPLIEENRVLVKHGLVQLSRTTRPGLRALLEALDMQDRPLSSADVAIKFAPKLNALSRMDQGILPVDLLLVEDPIEAQGLVEKVLATNLLRQQWQAAAEKMAFEQAEAQLSQGFLWVYSPEFHKGVIGLVATKLAKHFHLPAFVGSLAESGQISGSARAPDGGRHNLTEILASARDVLDRFGGHAAAAGFELHQSDGEHFGSAIRHHLRNEPSRPLPPLFYDGEGDLVDLDDAFLKWLDHLEPFGSHFESPLFLLRNVQAREVKTLKGGHLKLNLVHPRAVSRQAIWFSPTIESRVLDAVQAGFAFDMISQASWNYFRGRKSFQLVIQDIRLSKESGEKLSEASSEKSTEELSEQLRAAPEVGAP